MPNTVNESNNPLFLAPSHLDPVPILDLYRGNFATELLVGAVSHFDLFSALERDDLPPAELGRRLELQERPMTVLSTALRAMGMLAMHEGHLMLTELSREFLTPSSPHQMRDYLGLSAQKPGVLETVARLRANAPAGAQEKGRGAAFIYRDGIESAMEDETSARRLTMGLAGRARVTAPELAARVPLPETRRLLDVGGGSGLYSVAFLQRNPDLRAAVLDRPEVLKLAAEFAAEGGVADRLDCVPGDMFTGAVPPCDAVLLSNVLHDWDVPACRALVRRCAEALSSGGLLIVHDVLLNDTLDGPLPVALYSAALFTTTEGRAYSAAEYRDMFTRAGLIPGYIAATKAYCSALTARKP